MEQPNNAPLPTVVTPSAEKIGELVARMFRDSQAIRYVAFYIDGRVTSHQRDGLSRASAAMSDYYEEILVNPTLLMLAGQRGNLDCGGLNFLVIAYGNFYQLVSRLGNGHVSVSVEASADPIAQLAIVQSILRTGT